MTNIDNITIATDLVAVERSSQHVAVFGSVNADYTVRTARLPKPGETVNGGPLMVLPGGKSANQASAAARIGAHVNFFGALGSDVNAEMLESELTSSGVDCSAMNHVDGSSGTTVITVDDRGENTIVYSAGANAEVTEEYVDQAATALTGAAVLGLCLESPMPAVLRAAELCHGAGVRVLLNDSPFTPDLSRELVDCCDILLVNEHEMSQLLNIEEPSDGFAAIEHWDAYIRGFRELGFHDVIVTLGADGSVVFGDAGVTRIPAVRVKAVDTTGCGDAFMGSVLAGLAAGLPLERAAHLASYVSAYAATGLGAQSSYGSREQILSVFEP